MRIYITMLLAAIAMWSCRENDLAGPLEPGDGVLRFAVSVESHALAGRSTANAWSTVEVDMNGICTMGEPERSTRSAVIEGNTIPDGASIGVSAARVPGGGWDDQTIRPEYIYNMRLTRNGVNFTHTETVYWPDQPLRFFAYAPYAPSPGSQGITLSPKSKPGVPTINFNVAPQVADQIDLLAGSTPIMNSVSKVNLTLLHTLTRIGFSVRTSDIPEQVQVTSIELHNIINQGVQSFDQNNNITWSGLDYDLNTSTYVASIENGALKPDLFLSGEYQQITSPSGYMLLIPQEIKAGRTFVVLRYTVDGFPKELKTILPAALPNAAGGWAPGKSINYKISLSPEENEFIIVPAKVGSANSFILNSYSRSGDPTVDFLTFTLPITRVNEYYGNPAYARFYGSQTGIGPDTKWGVQIIWMDMANLLDITKASGTGDDPGADPSEATAFAYRTAPDPAVYDDRGRFKVRIRVNAEGNALIGIYKDLNGNGTQEPGEDFIWSWHLWITRYNPNYFEGGTQAFLPASSGPGAWSVINGAIHRYIDIDTPVNAQYNTQAFGSQTVWAPSTGLYAGLATMDRNLGAFSDGFPLLQDGQADRPLGALYYQYGRKDPFLSKAYRYTADGTPVNNEYLQDINTIRNTVQELIATPWIFPYASENNRGAWATNLPTDEPCSWFDPASVFSIRSSTDPVLTALPPKSIFDPSPYGWRLPVNGTWSGMTLTNSPWVAGMGRVFRFGATSVNFPAYGFRVASTGQFVAIGAQGCVWTCSTSNDTPPISATGRTFMFLRAGNTDALFQQTAIGYTTDATSVRPIQDPENPYPKNNFP